MPSIYLAKAIAVKKAKKLKAIWFEKYLDPHRSNHSEKIRQLYHEWDFEPKEQPPVICSHFGCAAHLSLRDQLFGDKCIKHSQKGETIL
jgi:hypothetical protein